jgi:hypothetical protein
MHGLVYILCAITSLVSALLLLRGARRHGNRLLFFSSLSFFAMTGNNVLLYANFVIFPDIDLLTAATIVSLIGIVLVNFGLIWHAT